MQRLLIAALVIVAATLTLAGCGGSSDTETVTNNSFTGHPEASLFYSYPIAGQTGIAPRAPIVLTFMQQVSVTGADFVLTAKDGTKVALAVKKVSADSLVKGGSSLVLTPKSGQPLATNTIYTLTSGKVKLPDNKLTFTTRAALQGSISATATDSSFKVAKFSPNGQDRPFVDFSSLLLTVTQPIDPTTAVYGSSIKLLQNGKLVPATLLVGNNAITIDPDQLLTVGAKVTLQLTNAVKSTSGAALAAFTQTLTPLTSASPTGDRATLVLKAAPAATDGCLDPNADPAAGKPNPLAVKSPLTGDPINCVPVVNKLLGHATDSDQRGNVYAQLAFAPSFALGTPQKGRIPLRIKKGSLLKGGALAVIIGGHVNMGFDSGPVTVTFMSDANGYLLPNPYTDNPNAPRRMVLTADMAFDTADPRANGAFTQNLMHVTLIGAAIADPTKGVLKVDAVGVVEPNVLGTEYSYGLLSFHMASYPDQTNLPAGVAAAGQQLGDQRPVKLLSWVPGTVERQPKLGSTVAPSGQLPGVQAGSSANIADDQQPGDPIILSFNKPLDKSSIKGGDTTSTDVSLWLTHSGARIPFSWVLNGAAVIITPTDTLQYSTPSQPSSYQIHYNTGIADLSGNHAVGKTLEFTMPTYTSATPGDDFPPLVTATYPGFPCVTTDANLPTDQGYCASSTAPDATQDSAGEPVDRLPIDPMPANRSIHISFTQVLDQASVKLGTTFVVEDCNSDSICSGATPITDGKLTLRGRQLSYTPATGWKNGELYRYTLKSQASGYTCGTDAICSQGGHALQTSLLNAPGATEGGDNLVIYFRGAPASDNVLQLLQNLPTADVNANFVHDPDEPTAGFDPAATDAATATATLKASQDFPRALINSTRLKALGHTDAVDDVNVGCKIGEQCANKKYLYMTGSLDADVVGFKTAAQVTKLVSDGVIPADVVPPEVQQNGGIQVNIYPTQIITSSADAYANVNLVGALCANLPPLLASGCHLISGTVGKLLALPNQLIPTGTGVMRIRYQDDVTGKPTHTVTGWIYSTADGPRFHTVLNVYMDEPYLKPAVLGLKIIQHSLHNTPLPTIQLDGAVNVLPDGRLQIRQISQDPLSIEVGLSFDAAGNLGAGTMTLGIPAGGIVLNYLGKPVIN